MEAEVDGTTIASYLKPGTLFAQYWWEECVVCTANPLEWRPKFALGILGAGVPDHANEWKLPARPVPNTDGHVLLFEGIPDCVCTMLEMEKPDFRAKLLRHMHSRSVLPMVYSEWALNPETPQGRDIWLGERAIFPLLNNSTQWLDAVLDALGCLVLRRE